MTYDDFLSCVFYLIFVCNIGFISFYSIQGYLLVKNWKGERKPIIYRMLWGLLILAFMALLFIFACVLIGAEEMGGFNELWKVLNK